MNATTVNSGLIASGLSGEAIPSQFLLRRPAMPPKFPACISVEPAPAPGTVFRRDVVGGPGASRVAGPQIWKEVVKRSA
jgi:hypothetical protein